MYIRGDTHMTSTLRGDGGWVYGKNEMLSDVEEGRGSQCSIRPIFFIKGNWICAKTRDHAEASINLSLKKILLFLRKTLGSEVRQ